MGRLTKSEWGLIQIDYEVNNLSMSEIEKKYGINRSNVSRKVKKLNWRQEETQQIIEASVRNKKENINITQQKQQMEKPIATAIEKEVDFRLEMEGIFNNAIKYNQMQTNKLFKKAIDIDEGTLMHADQHSKITSRNKEAVLGKSPDTAIQINNNANTQKLTLDDFYNE